MKLLHCIKIFECSNRMCCASILQLAFLLFSCTSDMAIHVDFKSMKHFERENCNPDEIARNKWKRG